LQSDVSAVVELLLQFALDTITVDSTHGSRGQQLTTLTLICKPDDGDEVAAALLQVWTGMGKCPAQSAEWVLPPSEGGWDSGDVVGV
jgi:hypothetical protein